MLVPVAPSSPVDGFAPLRRCSLISTGPSLKRKTLASTRTRRSHDGRYKHLCGLRNYNTFVTTRASELRLPFHAFRQLLVATRAANRSSD